MSQYEVIRLAFLGVSVLSLLFGRGLLRRRGRGRYPR